ncbi:MAG: DUF4405 domain-containing protein, partial [Acidimicrobiia bacterium]|nr:DUF4405 domain-containing protein [Acidimicrobiia bacterium]
TTQHRAQPVSTWARKRSVKIVLDTLLLVAFLAEFVTREGPDYTIHSWVGIALIPIIAVHLTGNVGWIKRVWNRKRQDREFGLGVLNATLGMLAAVCIATGFPLWLEWSDAEAWTAIHTITGMAGIIIMFVHLWKNRARISRLIRA